MIKSYIYKARFLKKLRKIKRKYKKRKRYIFKLKNLYIDIFIFNLNKIVYEYKFILYKIRYFIEDYFLFKKYNIIKYLIINLYLPLNYKIFIIKKNILIFLNFCRYYKTKIK
jgi:hypothetical protein